MVIDKDTYKLNESNFYSKEFDKTQIVLGNSFSTNLNHLKGWEKRYNGNYKKTQFTENPEELKNITTTLYFK